MGGKIGCDATAMYIPFSGKCSLRRFWFLLVDLMATDVGNPLNINTFLAIFYIALVSSWVTVHVVLIKVSDVGEDVWSKYWHYIVLCLGLYET